MTVREMRKSLDIVKLVRIGDVYMVKGDDINTSESPLVKKVRPCIILRHDNYTNSVIVLLCKTKRENTVVIQGTHEVIHIESGVDTLVCYNQVKQVPVTDLMNYIGTLRSETIEVIKRGFASYLKLDIVLGSGLYKHEAQKNTVVMQDLNIQKDDTKEEMLEEGKEDDPKAQEKKKRGGWRPRTGNTITRSRAKVEWDIKTKQKFVESFKEFSRNDVATMYNVRVGSLNDVKNMCIDEIRKCEANV